MSMETKFSKFFSDYLKRLTAFAIAFVLVRIYEYILIAHKAFLAKAYSFELLGLFYDCWFILVYGITLLPIVYVLNKINNKIAAFAQHLSNVLLILTYLALLLVFSERNTPFDHELFTRSIVESWTTSKQMLTSGFYVFIPLIIYIGVYFLAYWKIASHFLFSQKKQIILAGLVLLAILCIHYSTPNEDSFEDERGYHLTVNKVSFWIIDSYQYFRDIDKFNTSKLSKEELSKEIDFYQANQPFEFTSKEFPLLHKNTSPDVLGGFFNLSKNKPPNIVIIVVEGLSRDFSGANAYAGSFTPFLDNLSKKSLVWDNFLSTAPGTFAAHPAISGSLPYGKRGFSVINVMPEHLSLIKILRANGYHSKFLIGFNPDFDNMGGYMRLQGTDMILLDYPSKYKMMGIGAEGWTMGYPDDALFNRSFEVMDSLKQTPYLNIYHTGTTHMPYLFEQQHEYEKLFDKKISVIPNSAPIKKTLRETKKVLVTYMFSDDCLKNFFSKYSKRSDYSNTIFFIMGDHHIGSFPSTNGLDDYHVPLIVYSPLLKAPKKFYSISSHNNIGPTISSLILNNYPSLRKRPEQVHWLTDVIDTSVAFRNIHSMPFMEWSREITDYIYKDYYLSGKQLYKINPDLSLLKVKEDTIKQHMIQLLDNYKLINDYVTTQNKIFPTNKNISVEKMDLLMEYGPTQTDTIYTKNSDIRLIPEKKMPKGYKDIYVELSADINLNLPGLEDQPAFRFALIDTTKGNRNFVFWTNHNIVQMTQGDYVEKKWNPTSITDRLPIDTYKNFNNLVFDLSFYNSREINLQMRNLKIKVYGIKK